MAKKKRQLRLLLLLLAVAVALFVAAFCWNRWQTAQEEAEAEAQKMLEELGGGSTQARSFQWPGNHTFSQSGMKMAK